MCKYLLLVVPQSTDDHLSNKIEDVSEIVTGKYKSYLRVHLIKVLNSFTPNSDSSFLQWFNQKL